MSGIAGGTHYGGYSGGYGGDSKYDSYNSKNYGGKSSQNRSYGNDNVGGMGVYGDYSYNKSTLDKDKNNEKNPNKSTNITGSNSPSIIPDITGGAGQSTPVEASKKAFRKDYS